MDAILKTNTTNDTQAVVEIELLSELQLSGYIGRCDSLMFPDCEQPSLIERWNKYVTSFAEDGLLPFPGLLQIKS